MNHSNRLIPACQRLTSQAMVPARTFFSRAPWNMVVQRHMEDVDRQFARLDREMNAAFRDRGFPVPRIGRSFDSPNITGHVFPTVEVLKSPGEESGKPGKYIMKVDLGDGIAPEDIKVNLKDRMLTVHAKLEKKSEDGRIYQEFTRSFTLPEQINAEEVKSLLTPEGVLTIEAPLPEIEAQKPKEIPISIESKSN